MAHQRVGEGRLARSVRAHDRVDLALADLEIDPLKDLVLGLGKRGDAEASNDEPLLVDGGGDGRGGGGLLGHGAVKAP